jgi:hypothetical protein
MKVIILACDFQGVALVIMSWTFDKVAVFGFFAPQSFKNFVSG